ncbi:MAG: terpene cyclase/mutase family protein, partial [Planctomycetaceae bacterium]|nr:terpene cyclase/mutase family protein [Planctomycetaceae bacterium]
QGLLVSSVVHAVLLLGMVMIVVGRNYTPPLPGFSATWLSEEAARIARMPAAPVRISPMAASPTEEAPATDQGTKPPPADAAGNPSSPPTPVRPVPVEQLLATRDAKRKQQILGSFGENDDIERAVSRGLAWLKRQQQQGGNWRLHDGYPDASYSTLWTDTGATALALLALQGAGHNHAGGEFATTIGNGLNWLKSIQKADGDFHDHYELGRQTAFYAHSQATIAICEALILTGDESFREPAERAVGFLLKSQQPLQGGWKYQPQDEMTVGDLSVTGWALMALHTARAASVPVPDDAFRKSSLFLDACQERDGSRYKYMPNDPADRVTASMTAEGLLCRQYLGWSRENPQLLDGVEWLLSSELQPQWVAGRRHVYEWYYTGNVLHNQGGDTFKTWYSTVAGEILGHQVKRGSSRPGQDVRGSWHPSDPPGNPFEYADKAGRLYLTSMCLLVLETPWRHSPIYSE